MSTPEERFEIFWEEWTSKIGPLLNPKDYAKMIYLTACEEDARIADERLVNACVSKGEDWWEYSGDISAAIREGK